MSLRSFDGMLKDAMTLAVPVDEGGASSYSRNLIGEVAEWSKAALC
jgi:hypothetical protein